MPLPFSFSTQRQGPEVERPADPTVIAVSEKVMNHAPGHVSTEPLLGTAANPFPIPAMEQVQQPVQNQPRFASAQLPPGHSQNQPFGEKKDTSLASEFPITVLQLPPPASNQPASKDAAGGQDWTAQIDQLRNDIFGIAMNVSALNDRLDRMEQRIPPSGQTVQAGFATLRGEIETWLEKHLGAAVEHCMHQINSRTKSPLNNSVN